jgi:hypothetical protein
MAAGQTGSHPGLYKNYYYFILSSHPLHYKTLAAELSFAEHKHIFK